MKAFVYKQYGAPEVLKFQSVETPVPNDREVLIKVHATTVTAADFRVRSFTVPWALWLPMRIVLGIRKPKNTVLGAELAGEVAAVGKGVTRFKPGDPVFASTLPSFGAYAEYTCLPENVALAPKPSNLNFKEAAALPIGARTALHYLRQAKIRSGQKVLVYGASGSVGTYAVQLAKYFGADVTGVCSTANLGLVKSLGADRVVDYTVEDFSQSGEKYDVIFEAVNRASFASCARSLKAEGIYLNINNPFPTLHMLWTKLTSRKQIILGESVPEKAEYLIFPHGVTSTQKPFTELGLRVV